MGGGIIQLAAYGAENVYLTGNPQMTFFKMIYKRHTNFAIESLVIPFKGKAQLGQKTIWPILNSGNLLYRMQLFNDFTLTNGNQAAHMGHTLIDYIQLNIDTQRIDKYTGPWIQVWNELTRLDYKKSPTVKPNSTTIGSSVNGDYTFQSTDMNGGYLQTAGDRSIDNGSGNDLRFQWYLPLLFWFCKNPALALPLVAMNEDIEISIQYKSDIDICGTEGGVILNDSQLYGDFIFLDTEERERFANNSHEYLIEQVQYVNHNNVPTDTTTIQNYNIDFIHPCKELIWGICNTDQSNLLKGPNCFISLCDQIAIGNEGTTTDQTGGTDGNVKIVFNSSTLIDKPMSYFTRFQTFHHHTCVPKLDRIGVYSFALKPEEYQPSGSCNFSRIDHSRIELRRGLANTDTCTFRLFATNYNVLRIFNGKTTLVFQE